MGLTPFILAEINSRTSRSYCTQKGRLSEGGVFEVLFRDVAVSMRALFTRQSGVLEFSLKKTVSFWAGKDRRSGQRRLRAYSDFGRTHIQLAATSSPNRVYTTENTQAGAST